MNFGGIGNGNLTMNGGSTFVLQASGGTLGNQISVGQQQGGQPSPNANPVVQANPASRQGYGRRSSGGDQQKELAEYQQKLAKNPGQAQGQDYTLQMDYDNSISSEQKAGGTPSGSERARTRNAAETYGVG